MKAPDDPLEQLRVLLLHEERRQLGELREHVLEAPQRAADVAASLPEALRLAHGHDADLAAALHAPVQAGLHAAAREQPAILAEALAPAIGPALRRSLASSLLSWGAALEHLFMRRRGTRGTWGLSLIGLLLLAGVGAAGLKLWQHQQLRLQAEALEARVRGLADRLNTQPGLVVAGLEVREGRWTLRGLRDPLATSPDDEISRAGLSDEQLQVVWVPYQSLDPGLVERRAAKQLRLPPGVRGRLQNGVLVLEGRAALGWIQSAQQSLVLPPGVEHIDTSAVESWERPATATPPPAAAPVAVP